MCKAPPQRLSAVSVPPCIFIYRGEGISIGVRSGAGKKIDWLPGVFGETFWVGKMCSAASLLEMFLPWLRIIFLYQHDSLQMLHRIADHLTVR